MGTCVSVSSLPRALRESQLPSIALVSMFIIVFSVLVRGPTVDPSLRGSDENVFSVMHSRVFEAIGVISFAVSSPSLNVYISRLTGGVMILESSMSVIIIRC